MDLAYVAGFFDGEGSIGIYRGGSTRGSTLRTQVTQNVTDESQRLLFELRDEWGGSVAVMNRSLKRPAYNWQTGGITAYTFLISLRPLLRLRVEQAEVAIEWWEGRVLPTRDARGRMTALAVATQERDQAFAQRLVALKKGD